MPFVKGQSGNPSGKPKASTDAKILAKALMPEAFKALRAALKRPGERVPAATLLLAYAAGKPMQNNTLRVIRSIEELSDDELRVIAGEAEDITHQAMLADDSLDESTGEATD